MSDGTSKLEFLETPDGAPKLEVSWDPVWLKDSSVKVSCGLARVVNARNMKARRIWAAMTCYDNEWTR